MKKGLYSFLILLPFIFLFVWSADVAFALGNEMGEDAILGEDGFAEKAGNFTKYIPYIVIAGAAFSGYIFYKKSK